MSNCESRGRNITVIGPVKWINDDDDHIDNVAVGTHDEDGSSGPLTPDIYKIRNKKTSWIFPTFAILLIFGLIGLFVREKRRNMIRQLGQNNHNGRDDGVSSEAPPMSMALLMMGMSYLFLNKQQQHQNQHQYPQNGAMDDEMKIPNIVTDDDDEDIDDGNAINTSNLYYSDHPPKHDGSRELEIPTIVSTDDDEAITTQRNNHNSNSKVVRMTMTGPVLENANGDDTSDDGIVLVRGDGTGDMLVDVNVDIDAVVDVGSHQQQQEEFEADCSDDEMPVFA